MQREPRRVFRQGTELCLIWLHDILHILQQTQGHLFAPALTFLPSDALASCSPVAPSNNSLPKFSPFHTPPISLHPSCIALSSLVSSLSYASDVLPSPSPYRSVSLSFSLPSIPLLWRSGMMRSQRARPCLITLIKHPVRWNDLAPHNPHHTLHIPHHFPFPPFPLVEVPRRPSPVSTRLRFMADCEARSQRFLPLRDLFWTLNTPPFPFPQPAVGRWAQRKTETKAIPSRATLPTLKTISAFSSSV